MTRPSLLDEIVARYERLGAEERRNVAEDARVASQGQVWVPNPGPQTEAYFSPAGALLYGGQAAGGKSDLLLGLAVSAHQRSLIMRREYVSLSGLTDRLADVIGRSRIRFAPPPRATTEDGRVIEFGAAKDMGDEQKFQGRGRDFLGLDEAAQFTEDQVRFLMGWNRTTTPGQRERTVFATNPPLDARGEWIIEAFRPWLDSGHPNPAAPGELRWFVTAPDGVEIEAPDGTPLELDGQTLRPTSRTFIPSALEDNPYLARTDYRARLDALSEPLRSAVRDGDFMATRQDDDRQLLPSAWVRDAQARWQATPPDHAPMCAIGVDVARGGADQTVLAMRHDGWFAPLIVRPGSETPLGADVAGVVVANRRDGAVPVIDVGGGYGGAVIEHLAMANNIECEAFNSSAKSTRRSADRHYRFINRRAEAWWRFREALDPGQAGGSPIQLPPDPVLAAELTAPIFIDSHKGIQVEAKDKIRARLGRSSDRADAVVMAWSRGPRWRTHETVWRSRAKFISQPKAILGRAHQKQRR